MANTNNASPNVSAGGADDNGLGGVFSKSFIDAIVSGFGKGLGAVALMALVAVPLIMGGLGTVGMIGGPTGTLPPTGFPGFLHGAMGGGAAGVGFLSQAPGWAALAAGGLVGSYTSWVSNKQATAVANVAQQNADLKSQLEDYHQQNVTVQVDQQPGRASWNRRDRNEGAVVEVHPGFAAQEEQRRAATAAQPNEQKGGR